MRSLGFENSGLRAENGIIIVVKRIEAEYLAPARLDDTLVIQSRLLSIKNTSFVMEQKAVKEEKDIFVASILLVCTTEDLRPAKIPDAVKEIFLKEMEQNA